MYMAGSHTLGIRNPAEHNKSKRARWSEDGGGHHMADRAKAGDSHLGNLLLVHRGD